MHQQGLVDCQTATEGATGESPRIGGARPVYPHAAAPFKHPQGMEDHSAVLRHSVARVGKVTGNPKEGGRDGRVRGTAGHFQQVCCGLVKSNRNPRIL